MDVSGSKLNKAEKPIERPNAILQMVLKSGSGSGEEGPNLREIWEVTL